VKTDRIATQSNVTIDKYIQLVDTMHLLFHRRWFSTFLLHGFNMLS